MQIYEEEIGKNGKRVKVAAIRVDNNVVIIQGKFIKTARIKEEWHEDVEDPEPIIRALKDSKFKADIFTFMQRLPESKPKYDYYMEWDNVAAIPIKSYDNWFKNQIHQNHRNKIRIAKKKGVEIRTCDFNEDMVRNITRIFNETPIRQGKSFDHYGKNIEDVRKSYSTFLDRACFIGAYFNDELIGYIKLVSTGKFMRTMGILSMIEHRDKSPTNALLAKAVEICAEKKIPYLVYAKFDYGKVGSASLMNFKRYNGFESIILPRYFIPFTLKGKIILKLNLHQGLIGIIPNRLVKVLLDLRNKWHSSK